MNIFRRIQQIHNDHRAMNAIREGNGDIHLIAVATTKGVIYECIPWQSDEFKMEDVDPALAIIKAIVIAEYFKNLSDRSSKA